MRYGDPPNTLDLGGLLDMATTKNITVSFKREKPTPNTVRYAEVVEDGADKLVGVLYIQKPTFAKLGEPETLTVTLAVG
jgi:hypothetical protein